MESLFDLTEEARQWYEIAADEELDPQVFEDTLDSIMGAIEVKAESYLSVIERLDMEMKKAKEIEKRYAEIKTARENSIAKMKKRLAVAMEQLGKKELAAGNMTIKLQNNGGVQPMDVKKEQVPQSFMKVVYEADNEKIRKYLETLEDGKCEWAELKPRGKHIVVR